MLPTKFDPRLAKINRHKVHLSRSLRDFHAFQDQVAKGLRYPKTRQGDKHITKALKRLNRHAREINQAEEFKPITNWAEASDAAQKLTKSPIRTLADI